jgi:ATP-dependent Clp protease adaptor protein ClpS
MTARPGRQSAGPLSLAAPAGGPRPPRASGNTNATLPCEAAPAAARRPPHICTEAAASSIRALVASDMLLSRINDERVRAIAPMATPAAMMSDGDRNDRKDSGSNGPATGVVIKARPKTKKPSMYKVLMLNDDYTPMEFVVHVLERFFNKTREEATRIMLHVHRRGVGVCGVYTYEVAETKVTQVMDLARQNQHPLQCTIEKD